VNDEDASAGGVVGGDRSLVGWLASQLVVIAEPIESVLLRLAIHDDQEVP
jgi:hypothetical protein